MLRKPATRFKGTMPQKAIPSNTLAAAVRAYLGLTQEQLADYLGVSRGQVAHVEAGRRPLRAEAACLLRRLAALLPLPDLVGGANIEAVNKQTALPPAEKPLLRRWAKCRWQLANLQQRLDQSEKQAELALRWQALPATTPEPPTKAPDEAAIRRDRLLREWATMAADALAPATVAERQLLMLRIQFLAAEARALEKLLTGLSGANPLPGK
ncbi:helix-turn-helix transcriptional regulator [Hymenobacter sp. ISL-91]|uniref:helix-turn-helix domain-containing protein n=1 Tax=Hymenobacter sp. ISL-91 TaxID=2819151 RepID=UPI001BE75271|nr:helix-turn-helix transcriptional regulator [Hymenobacter sp. ISL-91]